MKLKNLLPHRFWEKNTCFKSFLTQTDAQNYSPVCLFLSCPSHSLWPSRWLRQQVQSMRSSGRAKGWSDVSEPVCSAYGAPNALRSVKALEKLHFHYGLNIKFSTQYWFVKNLVQKLFLYFFSTHMDFIGYLLEFSYLYRRHL